MAIQFTMWDDGSDEDKVNLYAHAIAFIENDYRHPKEPFSEESWEEAIKKWEGETGKDRSTLSLDRGEEPPSKVFDISGRRQATSPQFTMWDDGSDEDKVNLYAHSIAYHDYPDSFKGDILITEENWEEAIKVWEERTGKDRSTLSLDRDETPPVVNYDSFEP